MKLLIKSVFFIALTILAGVFVFSLLSSEVTKTLDGYIYTLPFEAGTKHRVVQGYGGLFSHNHIAAIDFAMPEGTAVYAAREGNVYSFKDDSNEGGPLPRYEKKANYIIIKHPDGSFGCYWHLKQNGVIIKNGWVAKGQLIGYSGSTGFVLRPHLHFSVKRKLNYTKDAFVKTKFKTSGGIVLLKNYNSYERPVE